MTDRDDTSAPEPEYGPADGQPTPPASPPVDGDEADPTRAFPAAGGDSGQAWSQTPPGPPIPPPAPGYQTGGYGSVPPPPGYGTPAEYGGRPDPGYGPEYGNAPGYGPDHGTPGGYGPPPGYGPPGEYGGRPDPGYGPPAGYGGRPDPGYGPPPGYGTGADYTAAPDDTGWAQQPAAGGWQGPPPQYEGDPAGPGEPPRRRTGVLIAALIAVAVVLAGLGTGLFFLLRPDGGDSGTATAADRASARDTSGSAGGSAGASSRDGDCEELPTVTVSQPRNHAGEMAVDATFSTSCRDGLVFDESGVVLSLYSDDMLVAANTFDFSRQPMVIDPGKSVTQTVGFGKGDFLLPPDMIDSPVTVTVETDVTGPAIPPGAAEDALALLIDTDAATIGRYGDRWVPQISAKKPGLVAPSLLSNEFTGDVRWDAQSILAEHLLLRSNYNALLLYSGDWSTYDLADFYVSVVDEQYSTPEQVISWCERNSLGRDDCLAKVVSDSRGPEGSTRLQRN